VGVNCDLVNQPHSCSGLRDQVNWMIPFLRVMGLAVNIFNVMVGEEPQDKTFRPCCTSFHCESPLYSPTRDLRCSRTNNSFELLPTWFKTFQPSKRPLESGSELAGSCE
jgi:hypothetical protein